MVSREETPDPLVRRKERAMLAFTDWPSRTWKVTGKSTSGVDDLDTFDQVSFTLDSSSTLIKINSITCAHGSMHDAIRWKNKYCGAISPASNKVKSMGPGGYFEIVSSEVDEGGGKKHNMLTCTLLNPKVTSNLESDTCDAVTGGVCWTAEDG
jgi:hypothetical protein